MRHDRYENGEIGDESFRFVEDRERGGERERKRKSESANVISLSVCVYTCILIVRVCICAVYQSSLSHFSDLFAEKMATATWT